MWFEDARPLIDILHWWLRTKNHYMVHGGAVGTEYGGALLAGHGGAGKSTTALTCLISGMKYAADDFCLIGKAEGVASVFGIYTSAKLHPHGLEQLPALNDCVSERPCLNDGDDSKKILFLHPEFQNQIAARMPLRLILLPRIGTNRETTFAPATHHNVIKALIPSSMEILKGSELNDFYGVFALTRRLPAFFLDLGSDKTHIASTIASLIRAVTDGLDPLSTVSSAIDQFESPLAPKYKQPACPN
jgi:hypothetical protein